MFFCHGAEIEIIRDGCSFIFPNKVHPKEEKWLYANEKEKKRLRAKKRQRTREKQLDVKKQLSEEKRQRKEKQRQRKEKRQKEEKQQEESAKAQLLLSQWLQKIWLSNRDLKWGDFSPYKATLFFQGSQSFAA